MHNYKEQLQQEREKLEREIEELKTKPEFGNDEGEDDETDEDEAYYNQIAAAEVLEKKLAEIEVALVKIDTHGYGVCEECNEPIEESLLALIPETRHCRLCKEKENEEELETNE